MNKENIRQCLNRLETLARALRNQSEIEKLHSYSAIVAIIAVLDDFAIQDNCPIGLYREYRGNLLRSCKVLAGIHSADGHDDLRHTSWACNEINKMRSSQCFKVHQEA